MKRSLATIRRLHRANAAAPVATLAAFLVVLLFSGSVDTARERRAAAERVTGIESTIAAIPYRLGDWAGVDTPPPVAALEILHSSAVLSRRYSNIRTGEVASFAIVYCGDVRDMLGHHPPVCYPAAGWQVGPDSGRRTVVKAGERTVEANLFRFHSVDGSGLDRRITIVGFFALPGVGLTPDEEAVRSRSARRTLSSVGSGQVQVLMDGWPSEADAVGAASSILSELPPRTFEMLLQSPADIPRTPNAGELP